MRHCPGKEWPGRESERLVIGVLVITRDEELDMLVGRARIRHQQIIHLSFSCSCFASRPESASGVADEVSSSLAP
jgi:hypothetical protein